MSDGSPAAAHFGRKRPGWLTKNVFNRIVAAATKLGISVLGSRVLEVRGRCSGEPRQSSPFLPLAAFTTSSIVPFRKNALSVTSSCLPWMISSKPRIVSAIGT